MDRKNKFDQLYVDEQVTARQRKLMAKFEVKPYAVEFRTLYRFAFTCGVLFQILSLATAITLPASWFHAIFHNWGIGFLIGGLLVLLLEGLKRLLGTKAFKNFFQFKKKGLLMVMILPSVASIVCSVLGTPILIQEFGATPTLQDTSTVAQTYDMQIASAVAYWDDKEQKAEQKANDIHSQNNWKGVTVRDAQDDVLAERNRASSYADSSVIYQSRLQSEKDAAIAATLAANDQIRMQDAKDKEHAGMILGGVTFGLELLFVFILGWCERYDFKEALFIHSQKKVTGRKLTNSDEKVTESQPKDSGSGEKITDTESQQSESGRNRIGFIVSEGTIKINEHGTPVIAYEKEKGGVSWYRIGQLTSQITEAENKATDWIQKGDTARAQTYKARAGRLKTLKKQLKKQLEKNGG